MRKVQLEQIKTFQVNNYHSSSSIDDDVNRYVIELYNKTGNYPRIETNSKFISVVSKMLVVVDRD